MSELTERRAKLKAAIEKISEVQVKQRQSAELIILLKRKLLEELRELETRWVERERQVK